MEHPIETKDYTRTDLITFGNYLLSLKRDESFENLTGLPDKDFQMLKQNVHHADIENWLNLNDENINASVMIDNFKTELR